MSINKILLAMALGLALTACTNQQQADEAVAEAAEASARHDDTAIMAREIAREAELAVREAGSTVMQWRAMLAARTASTAASTRQRRGWELGELGLSEWLLAERNSRQISLAEIMARADAVEARLRVLVDSHELWHTVN